MIEQLSIDVVLNVILLSLLLVTSLAVVKINGILSSTIIFSIFSLLMAALYLTLSAPDVAITEAAVGAGIGTILLLCAIGLVGNKEKKTRGNFLHLLVVLATGAVLIYATLEMPHFGSLETPAQQHVGPHYLNESYKEIGIPNVVTAVLASYRGFDTLGEVFVIFTAAMSILLLLWDPKKQEKESDNDA